MLSKNEPRSYHDLDQIIHNHFKNSDLLLNFLLLGNTLVWYFSKIFCTKTKNNLTVIQSGIVGKKFFNKILAKFVKNFVVFLWNFACIYHEEGSEKIWSRSFFSQKKWAKSDHYHDSLPLLKIEPVPIYFSQNMI